MNSWIKCADRMPLYSEVVLVIDTSNQMDVMIRSSFFEGFLGVGINKKRLNYSDATHWLPLPDKSP